ncbi:hypothetical protein EVAR_28352_1 [Eumeta japonica]|uniref:Uncharacterized protein n=1 Tax=Eumeta variegata TaxID=151549 RepID=A0A4C1V8P7_EUMVA|nr:hypothetical protein EVAR_28352_1 [Eumeta japonica]
MTSLMDTSDSDIEDEDDIPLIGYQNPIHLLIRKSITEYLAEKLVTNNVDPLTWWKFALLVLVAVAFAAPKPAPAPAPAPAPQPRFLTYASGLNYVYPAAPAVVSPYASPLSYSPKVYVLYR